MSPIEITDRLIKDIEQFIKFMVVARSPETLRDDMMKYALNHNIESNFTVEEDLISMDCYTILPNTIGDISQEINFLKQIVPYKSGDKVDLRIFLDLIKLNREDIINSFQEIHSDINTTVVYEEFKYSRFSYLKFKLDNIHEEALNLNKVYEKLLEIKKNKMRTEK